MIRFSPFNPIYFGSRHGISPMLGYRCVFSDSDHIMLQCFHNVDEKPGDISIVDVETSHTVAMPVGRPPESIIFFSII